MEKSVKKWYNERIHYGGIMFVMGAKQSISNKIIAVFLVFTIFTLSLTGILIYSIQMGSYKRQCEINVRDVGEYLAGLMVRDGDRFIEYQDFYLKHYDEFNLPIDEEEYLSYQISAERMIIDNYPGKVLGRDIAFEDVETELQMEYYRYYHMYWLLAFEEARIAFDLPYTYYLVMDEENHEVMYMIDGERTTPNDHLAEGETPDPAMDGIMYLGDTYYNGPDEYEIMWKTWETGVKQNGFKEFNNSYGHTYCYYTPLVINGQKMGLIATEIEVDRVNKEILEDTLKQVAIIALVYLVATFAIIEILSRSVTERIEKLAGHVREYTESRDAGVADSIDESIKGTDEIADLSAAFSNLIRQVEKQIKSLQYASQELSDTKAQVRKASGQGYKDLLTGIRNRNAFEDEIRKLAIDVQNENTGFGLAAVDMNGIKQIKDDYGYENGNHAIRKLCFIVCHVFEHSPVFKVGGDKFMVVLKGEDLRNSQKLIEEFKSRLSRLSEEKNLKPWEKVSAAIGVAYYDKDRDLSIEDLAERAVKEMQRDKSEMKAEKQLK